LANGQKIAANHGLADFSSVVLKSNRVSFAIAFYAKEKDFDHIVMGTGVTNDMERLFLGSVATEVVSETHCPVTIVR
jgi:nucleotide-binding universal stress UspA family protein